VSRQTNFFVQTFEAAPGNQLKAGSPLRVEQRKVRFEPPNAWP
jgi:hypothetical protein